MPKRTILDEKLKADYGLTPSTIEDIDRALYNYINDDLNVFCDTNEGFQKVPIIFASPERAYQIKNDPNLRNENGRTLEYPLISIIRSSMTKNPSNKGRYGVYIPPYYDFYNKGGSIPIARRVMQDKSRRFANATSLKRFGNKKDTTYQTFPFDNDKVVYETLYAPYPTYIEVEYEIKMVAGYQQQMNEIMAPFMAQFSTPAVFSITHESHTYESNNAGLGTDERLFKTSANIKVLGYLMGSDKNQDTPVTVVRESAVEVKIGRERTVLGDEPEFKTGRKDKYRR